MGACSPSEMLRLLLSGKSEVEVRSVADRAKVSRDRVELFLDGGGLRSDELQRLGDALLKGRVFIKRENAHD
jgi:hypothetical protein